AGAPATEDLGGRREVEPRVPLGLGELARLLSRARLRQGMPGCERVLLRLVLRRARREVLVQAQGEADARDRRSLAAAAMRRLVRADVHPMEGVRRPLRDR